MAEGDGTAVDVQLVVVDTHLVGAGQHLGGERLVDLDEVDVPDGQARPVQGLTDRLDGTQTHDLRIQSRHPGGYDPGQRGHAQFSGPGVAHHHHRGGPVVERAGVTSGDRAVGAEHRAELAHLLVGGAGSDAVVGGDGRAVGQRVGGDLPLEESASGRFLGPVLGPDPPFVLGLAGDPLVLGDVFGRLAHSDVDVGEPSRRAPVGRVLARTVRGAGLGRSERLVVGSGVGGAVLVAADALDASGDEGVALARLDGVEGHPDGLERRRAVAVHGHPRGVQTGQKGRHPGHVVALFATRLAGAPEDVLDLVPGELGDL